MREVMHLLPEEDHATEGLYDASPPIKLAPHGDHRPVLSFKSLEEERPIVIHVHLSSLGRPALEEHGIDNAAQCFLPTRQVRLPFSPGIQQRLGSGTQS
jgi:hypothetical protein